MTPQTLAPNLSLSYISISSQVVDEKQEQWLTSEISRPVQTLPWWVIIHTTTPNYTYYFGPFTTLEEAQNAQFGYVEDLYHENAQGLKTFIKQCQPSRLTICNE